MTILRFVRDILPSSSKRILFKSTDHPCQNLRSLAQKQGEKLIHTQRLFALQKRGVMT